MGEKNRDNTLSQLFSHYYLFRVDNPGLDGQAFTSANEGIKHPFLFSLSLWKVQKIPNVIIVREKRCGIKTLDDQSWRY